MEVGCKKKKEKKRLRSRRTARDDVAERVWKQPMGAKRKISSVQLTEALFSPLSGKDRDFVIR